MEIEQWISVEECLPSKNGAYLASLRNGNVTALFFVKGVSKWRTLHEGRDITERVRF